MICLVSRIIAYLEDLINIIVMKKLHILLLFIGGFSLSAIAQEYAENSFGIYTSGPAQAFGLQWNHQITEKTTFTAHYGQPVEQSWDANAPYYPNDDQTGQGYSGTTFQGSWTGVVLNHRPFENFDAFRVYAGAGVVRLGGNLEGLTDGYRYFINGHGPFQTMGVGYGLKPVKGLQWGVDVGLLRVPGFTTQTDGIDAAAAQASMDLTMRNHELPFFPNAQITLAWGF